MGVSFCISSVHGRVSAFCVRGSRFKPEARYTFYPGGRLGSILDGMCEHNLNEMGPFSASSEWHEWINFHSKWASYWPGHSIRVPFAFITDSG